MTDAVSRTPPFEPLNELERLLIAASQGGAEERAAFESAVAEHPLWAVLAPEPGDAPDIIRLRSIQQKDGRAATAVFTSRERALVASGPEAETVSWPGRVLLETIRTNPAVLNPGSGYGVRWSPDAMAQLVGRPNPGRDRRMPSQLARPAETPPGLAENLTRELSAEPAVRAAWLALAKWPDSEEGFLLDIRAEPSDVPIPVLINRALEGVDLDGVRFDVVVGSPDEPQGMGLEVVGAR